MAMRKIPWTQDTTTAEKKWSALRIGVVAEEGSERHRTLFYACPETDDGVDARRRIIEERLEKTVGVTGASIEYQASEYAGNRVMQAELRGQALANYLNLEREHDKANPVVLL